jgi:hypothetical protein
MVVMCQSDTCISYVDGEEKACNGKDVTVVDAGYRSSTLQTRREAARQKGHRYVTSSTGRYR